MKAEHSLQGDNPRYVVTSLPDAPKVIYQYWYCARGDMENRIKEQKILFRIEPPAMTGGRINFDYCSPGWLIPLVNGLRRLALKGTELETVQVNTIRLKLFKVAAVVVQNTRRIQFKLPEKYPYQKTFKTALFNLNSG